MGPHIIHTYQLAKVFESLRVSLNWQNASSGPTERGHIRLGRCVVYLVAEYNDYYTSTNDGKNLVLDRLG